MRRGSVIACLLAAACPAAAKDISLGFPLDCQLGETCIVSAYVDADGGPGAADHRCGPVSFDGHLGTDFAPIAGLPAQHPIGVLAAAPGRVLDVRDPALTATATGHGSEPEDAECKTQVTINHGGGWQTRYCGFAPGAIAVRPGRRVGMGSLLGRIGAAPQGPAHLHFSVRKDGRVVDPFNADDVATCDDRPSRTLWQDQILPGGE